MDIDEQGADKLQQYDTAVKSISASNQAPDECTLKTIEQLIKDIDTPDDPVYQEERRVPEKIIKLLDQNDSLIVPHALKLFYRIAPSEFTAKYRKVIDIILNYCQSDDRQLLDYAVDFIAAFGRHGYKGRLVLDRHPQFKEKCLSKLGSTIISSESLLKCRTLECIRDLLELQDNDPIEESAQLSEKFYKSIIEGEHKMTSQLLILCKVPFKEISACAALVVKAINDYTWGQQELAHQPELLKFIKP